MENKDAKLIRKFITLAESIQPKSEEPIINETQEVEVQETEQPIDEQVKLFQDAIKTLARVAGEEKALWQTIKTEIPAIGAEYKTLKEFQLAAEAGKISAVQSAELVKFAIKEVPELGIKIKGMLSAQPEFAELAKQVFPKGTQMAPNVAKMDIAKKTLSQMGIEGKQAEEMLRKAAQGAAKGGVSTKAIDKAIANRAKTLKGGAAEVKAVETNAKTGAEAAEQIKKLESVKPIGITSIQINQFIQRITKYNIQMFQKLRNIKSKLNWKNLILYGLAGWGTIEILKSLFGEGDKKPSVMPDCVVNLEGMEWGATSQGDAMIYTKNEFDAKSKGHGGLKFYSNGRVWTMDNQMSGTYACKAGKLQVSEEEVVGEQASNITITWDEKGKTPTPTPSPETGKTETQTGTTITYEECNSFPLVYGCKGDKVKKIQVCLGMPAKYQTGNLGPKTKTALEDWARKNKTPMMVATNTNKTNMPGVGVKFGVSEENYNLIVKQCEGGQVSGSTTGGTTTTTGTTSGNTTTTTGTTGNTTTKTTTTVTGETPSDLYARLVKAKTLVGRLRGRRIVYKGPDLTKEEREKLEVHMKKMGYRVSRDNFDYRKGDKIVFKRNKDEETTEPTGVTQEPTK